MNRRLFFILLLTVATLTTTAQPQRVEGLSNNQRLLGYTLTDDIDISGAAFGEAGTYSIGAAITPAALAPYAGCHVVGLRLAAAMNLGRSRTFVYNFTGTAFDVLIEQRQRLYEGWNTIFFNGDGYEIQGDETLFFGFDYVETQAMVDAEEGGICSVGDDTDGAFYLYGNYGQGEGLYTISNVGRLCVQLIIDVSSLPLYNMAITYLDTGFKHKQPGESFDILATFANVGRDTIATYQVGLQIDDLEPLMENRQESIADGHSESWTTHLTLPDDLEIGMHRLAMFIASINGEPVEDEANKRVEVAFAVYRDAVQRNQVYMEVYTDATTPYSDMLNSAVAVMAKDNDRVCIVNVHKPGTLLAVDDAAYLCDLYAYTYPSFTVNRAYFPGEAYVAYDMNDYLPIFGTEMSAGILSDIVMQDYASPAFASLELDGTYNTDSRQLTVTATGQLLPEAQAIYGDLALTLLITEDGVKSRQAVYNALTQRTTNNQNYVHDNVLRTFISSPLGMPLTSADGTFDASVTTTMEASWATDKLTVVGLLTKAASQVTSDDLLDMEVINTSSLKISELASTQGIINVPQAASNMQQASRNATTFYTLDGKQVDGHQLPPGLYIQHAADGSTRKVCIK